MRLVTLSSIRKYYPSTDTLAVDGADFSVEAGEVHALVGENGAGKSSLARILCGFEVPDSGTISVRGTTARFLSHRDAERAGIGFVPQYSMLAPGLSAAENVALGHEPTILGCFSHRRRAEYDFSMLSSRFGFNVDPHAIVATLSASERREVEILRALARAGDILVLDEPTSILGESETATLFALIRRLKDAGAGIVYISHRSREILDLADRISVMRSGRLERTIHSSEVDECGLAELIIRSSSCPTNPETTRKPGNALFVMRNVSMSGRGANTLEGLNLAVRSGEIVAVIALGGNGLETLEDLASGSVQPDSGEVLVLGRKVCLFTPRELRTGLMAYIPTDREKRGLCPRASVASNVLANRLFSYSCPGFVAGMVPLDDAKVMLAAFGVKAWERRRVDSLSGGNRQRVVVARELFGSASVVIAANPAQGLDKSSRAALFERLSTMRDEGSAILVLSSDPEDAMELADRSLVLYRGRLKTFDDTASLDSSLSAALTGAAS